MFQAESFSLSCAHFYFLLFVLFLGSGSIIHLMEALLDILQIKVKSMVLMGGLTKHIPITKKYLVIRLRLNSWFRF